MPIIDITRTIQHAPVYPGSVEFSSTMLSSTADGAEFNISLLQADSHIGTHLDAPFHALDDGLTIEHINLSACYGSCLVLTVPENTLLQPHHFSAQIKNCSRILFRSKGSSFLSMKAAEYLAACSLQLLGTDGLSIAPPDNELAIHQLLLRQQILLLENLDLGHAQDGLYQLCAFPLKIARGDGSPVRAVLIS